MDWDNEPVVFHDNVSYTCKEDNLYFENNKDTQEYNVTCLDDGSWAEPTEWPVCMNCKYPHQGHIQP
jgi:hypothetical protein